LLKPVNQPEKEAVSCYSGFTTFFY